MASVHDNQDRTPHSAQDCRDIVPRQPGIPKTCPGIVVVRQEEEVLVPFLLTVAGKRHDREIIRPQVGLVSKLLELVEDLPFRGPLVRQHLGGNDFGEERPRVLLESVREFPGILGRAREVVLGFVVLT